VIQDIKLAPRNAKGMVEYTATFQLVKPVDMTKSSHLMWHDVPNRGGRLTIAPVERAFGDIGLSSGWQGDNSGATAPKATNDYVVVPVAKNADGSAITGRVSPSSPMSAATLRACAAALYWAAGSAGYWSDSPNPRRSGVMTSASPVSSGTTSR